MQRRQDARRPKEAKLQQKTIQGYAALSNTHVPMTHNQRDSCSLCGFAPSRKKNISRKDARTQRDQRQPCSSKKTIQGYAALSNTHVPMTHNQRDSCSLCGFAPSREKTIPWMTQRCDSLRDTTQRRSIAFGFFRDCGVSRLVVVKPLIDRQMAIIDFQRKQAQSCLIEPTCL